MHTRQVESTAIHPDLKGEALEARKAELEASRKRHLTEHKAEVDIASGKTRRPKPTA